MVEINYLKRLFWFGGLDQQGNEPFKYVLVRLRLEIFLGEMMGYVHVKSLIFPMWLVLSCSAICILTTKTTKTLYYYYIIPRDCSLNCSSCCLFIPGCLHATFEPPLPVLVYSVLCVIFSLFCRNWQLWFCFSLLLNSFYYQGDRVVWIFNYLSITYLSDFIFLFFLF